MGFKISWLAFHGMGKADVLDAMALVDSGESDEANEAPFSGAELPDDWYIIFSNDFDYVSPNLLADVSKRCRVVACQVHEGVMFQAAYGYARGAPEWTVFHDAQAGMYDLSISGSPPNNYAAIKARLTKEQEDAGGKRADVDFISDIPIEVARSVCGYRHDMWEDWGEPQFTRLESR